MRRLVSRKEAMRRAVDTRFEIYGLVDPRDFQIHYVGRAKDCRKRRLKAHLATLWSEPGRTADWMRELYAERLFPVVVLLEEARGAAAGVDAERRWFLKGKNLGWPLKNRQTPSGGGLGLGKRTPHQEWTLSGLGLVPSVALP